MAIQTMLDLSIGHLPQNEVGVIDTNKNHAPLTYDNEQGWLIPVLDRNMMRDVLQTLETVSGEQMLYLRRVIEFARELGVDYIKFDADGPRIYCLEYFDW